MNINLSIIYDEITDMPVEFITSGPIQSLDISCILFIPAKISNIKSDALYICHSDQIPYEALQSGMKLAVIGDIDHEMILQHDCHVLVFPDDTDPLALCNDLQQIKAQYDKWDNEMLEAVLSGSSRQVIMDIGAQYLKNPVAFFDREFGLATTTGTIPRANESKIWDYVLQNKFSPTDSLHPRQRSEFMQRFFKSDWPFIYYSDIMNETCMTCGVVIEDTLYGNFSATEIAPFTDGQCAILYCIAQRVKQALIQSTDKYGAGIDLPFFLQRLLSGIDIETNVMLYHLHQIRWEITDHFRIVRIEAIDATPLLKGECESYRNPLKHIFSDSLITQYEGGLLIVIHAKSFCTIPDKLKTFLDKFKMRAGISMEFQNFTYVKYAYIQCKNALTCADGNYMEFEKHYTKSLLDKIAQITSLKSFCHPLLLQMYLEGSKKDRLFIESMQTYIESGRNMTDAAKKLGVHRNTLIYRLQIMNEYLGIDLFSDTISDNLQTLIVFSGRILQNL